MKKILVLTIMTLLPLLASAYDAEIDGIYYNFSGNEATVTYLYQSPIFNGSNESAYSGAVVIPESVSYNGKTYRVTSIGGWAFRECRGLTSVIIPNSVTSIGDGAFSRCNNLISVTIGNGVTSIVGEVAFDGCVSLTKVIVPDIAAWCGISFSYYGSNPLYYAHHLYSDEETEIIDLVISDEVTKIGNFAFSGCSGLTSVTIPNSVTSIGSYAFYGCSGLTLVTIPNSVTSISGYTFSGCSGLTSVTIPNSVINLGDHVFSDCVGLTSITIGNSVTTIGQCAFCNCSSLTSIEIPENVTSIGNNVFERCSSLTSATLLCKEIGDWFSGVYSIKELIIGNKVTSFLLGSFYGCNSLTAVHITDLTSWCNIYFGGLNPLYYAHHLYLNGNEIKDLVIPDEVTKIGNYAFKGCSGLTSVTIPNSVTSIGWNAFEGCSGLTSVTIPNSVTSIGYNAFSGCSGMISVTIGDSVNSIGGGAFSGCSSLTSITIPENVNSIGGSAFDGCSLPNILVKCATPPSVESASFTEATFYHAMLYIPTGSWYAYAFKSNWYKFINIRETTTEEEQLSMQQAYTLMDAGTFAYSVYDPVNDRISSISSNGIDENNPNHCWQVIEVDGERYLYNLGAKKFVTTSGNSMNLTSNATTIEMGDGKDGIVLGEQGERQWAFVSNDRMNVEDAIVDGIKCFTPALSKDEGNWYDLSGRKIDKPQKGINIIRYSDGTSKKVLIK